LPSSIPAFIHTPDLLEPENRILAYHDLAQELPSLNPDDDVKHGSGMALKHQSPRPGNGWLSDGIYRGLASDAKVVLVKGESKGTDQRRQYRKGYRVGNRKTANATTFASLTFRWAAIMTWSLCTQHN